MLTNSLTPPNEPASAYPSAVDTNHGDITATAFDPYGFHQFATPPSNASMGYEEKPDRAESQGISAGEEDMSDGGAPLSMTLSHAELLNAEMDMLDAEIMGQDNLDEIITANQFASTVEEAFAESYFPGPYAASSNDVNMLGMNDTNLPATMSAVSLQLLQHLEDGQEHGESADEGDGLNMAPNNMQESTNYNLVEFLFSWNQSYSRNDETRRRPRGPAIPALIRQQSEKVAPMHLSDLHGDKCDIQRIDWTELGVSRLEARQMRRQTYRNYTSDQDATTRPWHPRLNGAQLPNDQNFFRFRRMDFDHKVHLSHFQLRNLLACHTRDHVFYAARSKILHCIPQSNTDSARTSVAMDLTDPIIQPFHSNPGGIHITTMSVAHDILVAGGYDGEYSLVNLKASKHTKHIEGLITDDKNSITNHVQVHLSRSSSLPLAAFASNDNGFRLLDISTNRIVAEHLYDHAINCTAISPDQRLRVLVGDTRQVMICNAETGEVLQSLEGHRDFGFACDWADDGWTVATGNQDMQVKIWDARKWTNSSGFAQPITTIAADMACVRKLRFSPLGSGKRLLVAAEPADIVNVIDAESFARKQTLSFFGEIGGLDFSNDGQDLVVANCDPMRGGLMEFERCDFTGSSHTLEDYNETKFKQKQGVRKGPRGYGWMYDNDIMSHPGVRGGAEQRQWRPANLGIDMGFF